MIFTNSHLTNPLPTQERVETLDTYNYYYTADRIPRAFVCLFVSYSIQCILYTYIILFRPLLALNLLN